MDCEYCSNFDELDVSDYYGTRLCSDCIRMEEETDWDDYEEKKRQRIAEANEY